jgi:ParB family chromosome partitioning protein
VVAGRAQPRRRFEEDSLDELAESIRANGILQPLLVTEVEGRLELIAGERRLRAAARAGLDHVPVLVRRDVSVDQMVELALIENVQREDLTPIEQARGYQRLLDDHGYTQEQLALRLGKSRVTVTNSLRLLKLPREVCDLVDQRALSEGHARALLGLRTAAQQIRLAARAVKEQLSVRQTEDLVRRALQTPERVATAPAAARVESALRAAEQSMGRSLATRVRIRGSAGRGRIEVEFYSADELNRLIERFAT